MAVFIIFFINFFINIYQLKIVKKIKKDYKNKLVKDIKFFIKKKKKQEEGKQKTEDESKNLLSIEKKYYRMRKNAFS